MSKSNQIKSEEAAKYAAIASIESVANEDSVIAAALAILERRFRRGETLTKPAETVEYLQLKCASLEHEVFGLVMLDNRNRVLAFREIATGTIDGASVYPREVVKQALADNAAAVILYHNHPSGVAEPSQQDVRITERLKKALALIDIRVLDHIIVAGANHTSLASKGLV